MEKDRTKVIERFKRVWQEKTWYQRLRIRLKIKWRACIIYFFTRTVYVFLYNDSCCESAAYTISVHRTRKGAEKAMEFHKSEMKKAWEEDEKLWKENDPNYVNEFAWNYDKAWFVKEII
jgi:hypothetical protein